MNTEIYVSNDDFIGVEQKVFDGTTIHFRN